MPRKRDKRYYFRYAYEIVVTILIVASILVLAWFVNSSINTASH
jgi:hypothetical protein